MRERRNLVRLALASTLMLAPGLLKAQQPGVPEHPIDTRPEGQGKSCSYTVTDSNGDKITGKSNCSAQQPADTPASKRFPYPGEGGALDNPKASQPAASAPAAPAPAPGDSAAKRFPFPGEGSPVAPAPASGAAGGNAAGGLRDAGSSGESSSSSSSSGAAGESSSSSANTLPPDPNDVNSDTPPAPHRAVRKKPEPPPKAVGVQEAEDLQVAGFYMNDKNYRGAYGRAQHAIQLVADDADAHLALAEAARKLGMLDQAEKEYRRTLELDPIPRTRKTAERALKEMTGGG